MCQQSVHGFVAWSGFLWISFFEVTDFAGTVAYCVSSGGCGIGFNSRRLHQLPIEKPLISGAFFVIGNSNQFRLSTFRSHTQA